MANNSLPKLDEEFAKAQAQFPMTTAADMRTEYNGYKGHPWAKYYDEIVPSRTLEKPTLKDLDYYASNFGIDTSVANLQNKFDALTRQEYAQKNAEYRASEDAYYQNMAAQQAQYADAAQGAISQALANGASRGMQFANQFAAQNAIAEQGSTGALDLATQHNNLKGQEAEAYTQNAINAEQTSYDRKANILGQAVADHANEVQRYAADTQLEAVDRQLRIQNYQFNMAQQLEQHLAEQGYSLEQIKSFMDMYTSMFNTFGNMWGNKYTADKNYDANVYNANANVRAAYAGRSNEQAATWSDLLKNYMAGDDFAKAEIVDAIMRTYNFSTSKEAEEYINQMLSAYQQSATAENMSNEMPSVTPAMTQMLLDSANSGNKPSYFTGDLSQYFNNPPKTEAKTKAKQDKTKDKPSVTPAMTQMLLDSANSGNKPSYFTGDLSQYFK